MTNYYQPMKYGPISVGQTNGDTYQFGVGRTVTVVYSCNELGNDAVVLKETSDCVEDWIKTEWEDKVLLDRHTPNLDVFKTLQELEGININIMPDQYDCGLKSSSKYLYDKLNELVQLTTQGRVWIVEIEILEQRESYGFKTERYFGAHK